jgi:hypothetical protein
MIPLKFEPELIPRTRYADVERPFALWEVFVHDAEQVGRPRKELT